MPTTTSGTATADLTNHPIIETFTQAGWTFKPEKCEPDEWLVFERKTAVGVPLVIQYTCSEGDCAIYISGASFGAPGTYAPTVALQEADRFAEASIFGGWA